MKLNIPLKSARDGQVNAERLVNLYAEEAAGKAKTKAISVPGMALFGVAGSGPGRGLVCFEDRLYTVVGETFYLLDSSGQATELGQVYGVGPCSFASSGVELCIACEGIAYTYTYGGTLTQITDTDFLGADSVTYLDGYFIFSNGTGQFSISALYAGGTIDALDFASAESNPDPIVRAFVDHRELILFGQSTTEIWVNTGAADFPFERVSGGVSEKGLCNRNAVARLDNSVFWLDADGIARKMTAGYSPQRISTHQVEDTMVDIDQAECFAFVWGGHEFFVLTLPTITWIYDAATQLWHERRSFDETRWRARGYAFCYGKHIVGDYENGNLYELDDTVFAEAGIDLVAEMVFPAVANEGDRFRLHRLLVDMEVGEATEEPLVRLDLSDDGQVWNTVGTTSMGVVGARDARVVFRRLGQHRNLHIRLLISDPCKRAVYNAYGEVSADK